MADVESSQLTPGQLAILARLLKAGFRFVRIPRVERYLGVEKQGFAALLDTAGGKVALYSQVGYKLGDGVAVLVDRGAGKVFVWKNQSVEATPELRAAYDRFKAELKSLLEADRERE